jgi:hypothetical protein
MVSGDVSRYSLLAACLYDRQDTQGVHCSADSKPTYGTALGGGQGPAGLHSSVLLLVAVHDQRGLVLRIRSEMRLRPGPLPSYCATVRLLVVSISSSYHHLVGFLGVSFIGLLTLLRVELLGGWSSGSGWPWSDFGVGRSVGLARADE